MSNTTFDNESNAGSVRSSTSTVNTQFSKYLNRKFSNIYIMKIIKFLFFYRSSKRRKQKKSMISLKKGSAYEDLALIQELHDIITYACNLKDGISNLSKSLLLFNMNDLCIQIQTNYEKLMDLIEKNINQIWDYEYSTDNNSLQNSFTVTKCQTDFSKLG